MMSKVYFSAVQFNYLCQVISQILSYIIQLFLVWFGIDKWNFANVIKENLICN